VRRETHRDRFGVDPGLVTVPADHRWSKLPFVFGGLGLAGVLATAGLAWGGVVEPAQFFFSWLTAFVYFLSLALGGLFFVLVHFVTGARWSVVVRRLAESAMGTLPLFALLFLPVLFGLHTLYHWTHADAMAHDPLLAGKQPYLNTTFFVVRAAVYFVCWIGIAVWFLRQSRLQDAGDPSWATTKRMIGVSAPSLLAFGVTVTFAAIDWVMTLDPHWYSTIFGVYFFAGSTVGIFALVVLVAAAMGRAGLLSGTVTVEHFHDLGKMLFGMTVFWAYIGFSQFFLVWYGNIPEETVWYMHRQEGSWGTVTAILAWGHFGVPFLFLMPRTIKRRTGLLCLGATWMLLMHLVDVYWLVMPTLHAHDVHPSLADLTALVGIGGLFLGAMLWVLTRRPVVPLRDPRLPDSLAFENV
jgi:hypothetical protein